MSGNQHIHCTIENCHYYQSGNKCVANEILVATDQFGAQQPDSKDANMASQYAAESVNECMDSCCKSFVHKDSQAAQADGIKRMQ